ncbi:NAD(P)/FAD-dependent oxidoreductase [Priestia megaterium]|uniref:NAD(P)/FAD-dependent oxidoreductase n=1 Tax=Priestia megaterium TaxID=1404 RepID=UPI00203C8531|nr:NAD(P)/FAD-dependent oxidoreductase [Priestia megaterium]MCM3194783.1 NAD(P)-binding domain-containing protein [Priestia megaterium]
MNYSIVIVGAGPAGIGAGILLKKLNFNDFIIIEKSDVGSSFQKWPKEMKLITPSFTGQGFGALDLNAIAPDTSPAYTLNKEHLSGRDYAEYLKMLATHFDLPIAPGVEVIHVKKGDSKYKLLTPQGVYIADSIIWATGEYQFPNLTPFSGSEHAIHSSNIPSWKALQGEDRIIIGGYESGIDAAVNLIHTHNKVTVLSRSSVWDSESPDPSRGLSPYTKERLVHAMDSNRLIIKEKVEVREIKKEKDTYKIILDNKFIYKTKQRPILATGFHSGAILLKELFAWGEQGKPILTSKDESTETPNLFLIGPSVVHEKVIFCFIYKFRQRIAVVIKEILDRLEYQYDKSIFKQYQDNNMLLSDLSCCEVSCEC